MKSLSSKQQIQLLFIYLFLFLVLFNLKVSIISLSYFLLTGVWSVALYDARLKEKAMSKSYRFSFIRFFYYLHNMITLQKYNFINPLLGILIFFGPVILWKRHWMAILWVLLSFGLFRLSCHFLLKENNR